MYRPQPVTLVTVRDRIRWRTRFIMDGITVEVVAVIAIIGLAIGAIIGVSHMVAQPNHALSAAEQAGITNVEITGTWRIAVGFHGCSQDDVAAFKIRGVNPNGQPVTATVCKGIFKGATIRY